MKIKKSISAYILASMLFLTSNVAFSIEDVVLNTKTTDTEYSNDIHSNFSLEDCIKIALKNNLTITSSKLNEDLYKTKIGQAWANYFPELGLGVDWNRSRVMYFSEAYNMSYLPQISANMLIFDFGKTKAIADSAKRTYEAKHFDTDENINILICNVKKAYYNLLFSQAQAAVYKDTVEDFELQKKQAYTLYKAGKKAKVDVAIADYNLCHAKLNSVKAQSTLEIARYELSRIMGLPEYNNYSLTNSLEKKIYTVKFEDALENAYNVRPEILAAKKSYEAAKLNLRATKREYTPDVRINGSYGNAVGTMDFNSYQFGAGLNYNGLNLMRIKKKVDEANLAYKKSKIDFENLKQDLYLNVNKTYIQLQTAGEAIGIAEYALEQAKEQYRQTKGRYKAGIADIIELKDGENAYLNARLDYYNSLLNYNVSIADFEKEIGTPFGNYATLE